MNLQPPEKRTDSDVLEMVDIWRTIQGEGPLVGTPAVFVRLAGCNLQCPMCDTDYTSSRHDLGVEGLQEKIKLLCASGLVVLTGGEPFRQSIEGTVFRCLSQGYSVQIETNGTIFREQLPYFSQGFSVVCSPKTPVVHPGLSRFVDYWKYVVSAGEVSAEDGLPEVVLGKRCHVARPAGFLPSKVFVQPCDEYDEERNKRNRDEAVSVCLRYGYRLCLQVHKMVGLQ